MQTLTHHYEHHQARDDVLSTYPTEDMEWGQRSTNGQGRSSPDTTYPSQPQVPTLCSSPCSSAKLTCIPFREVAFCLLVCAFAVPSALCLVISMG